MDNGRPRVIVADGSSARVFILRLRNKKKQTRLREISSVITIIIIILSARIIMIAIKGHHRIRTKSSPSSISR